MGDLSGKRALVTGAGMGIGQGIAIELARQGADVAVHYAHSEKDANETVREVKRLGGKPALVQGDLSKIAECERVVDVYFALPQGPGLGLELNEEVIAAHPKRDVHFNLFAEGWEKRAATGTPGT